MSSPAGGEVRVGIGARLRAARERSGLTLLQAAERMHVDSKVLEALEAEEFESLGAPVFARGHLRRYAELIGEHAVQLQALYAERARTIPPPAPPPVPKMRRRRDSRKLVAPGVVGLIAIAIAGGVWLVLQLGRSNAEQAVEATEEIVAPPAASPQASVPVLPAPLPEVKTSIATRSASKSKPADSKVANADAKSAGATAEKPAAPAAPPKPRTVDVKLKFAADSWVEVYDVNGERLFYDIGSADSVRTVTGTPPLRVVLGNAQGVSLEVNGRARNVPDKLVKDEGAQFTINRAGRIVK
jgi:cytoskeleton protein RodZ